MIHRTAIFPTLACAFALAAGSAGAGGVSDAGTATGTDRLSSGEIDELRELLVFHGIPPARHLAGEITREIFGSNREAAAAAVFRPPAVRPQETAPAPARAAAARAREARAAEPVRASTPLNNRSPLRNALRKILRFFNLLN